MNTLGKQIYNTVGLAKFLNLREKGEVNIESFLEEHEKQWPKFRGDMNQLARHYENTEVKT